MRTDARLLSEVRACTVCAGQLPLGPRPILQLDRRATILIAGQAPGRKAHDSGVPFSDPSGDRLRAWMGIDKAVFYDASRVAILPMGLCFPGTGVGGDLPPRPECAPAWRDKLLALLPGLQLTLVIGSYAQDWHLKPGKAVSVTDVVAAWQDHWPRLLPMPHPSPRNQRWLRNNLWFEQEVLPVLRLRVQELIRPPLPSTPDPPLRDPMTTITPLAQQLADYKAGFLQRAAPERVAMMAGATAGLKATGIESHALQVGDSAPDVTLPDVLGRPVRLAELWQRGPLVLIFYRGGWCPYCNLELRAWQQHRDALADLGASLVAISPQTPDNSLSTAEKNELAYPVLSDFALSAANGFGVAFEMPQPLIDLYRKGGNDLPVLNGNGKWVLPLPATYVICRDGRIAFAHIEADYRERAEPGDVLMQLKRLQASSPSWPDTRRPPI